MMSCEDLPPELLERIFGFYIQSEGPRKFLCNVSAVSRRWRSSSASSSLWNEVTLWSLDYNFDHVLKLAERGLLHNTQVLNLNTNSREAKLLKLQPSNLVELTKYCHKVKRLDISGNYVSNSTMELLTKAWPEMDRLVMSDVTGADDDSDPNRQHPLPISSEMLNPIFRVWGKNLRCLKLSYCRFQCGDELLLKVADCCPSLEEFSLVHSFCDIKLDSKMKFKFPTDKLQRGCPKLRVLRLTHCDFVFQDAKDLIGFKEMRNFEVSFCNLNRIDINLLLNNCSDLKEINIFTSNATLSNITQIPSAKVKVLMLRNLGEPQKFLEEAIGKWRKTLTDLVMASYPEVDVTYILQRYLQDNEDPKLERVTIGSGLVQVPFLKIFIRACRKLLF